MNKEGRDYFLLRLYHNDFIIKFTHRIYLYMQLENKRHNPAQLLQILPLKILMQVFANGPGDWGSIPG